jgi:hypothetical protein
VNKMNISSSGLIGVPLDSGIIRVVDMNGKILAKCHDKHVNRKQKKILIYIFFFFFQAHKLMATCCVWSSDESVIFSGGFDRNMWVWGVPRSIATNNSTVYSAPHKAN